MFLVCDSWLMKRMCGGLVEGSGLFFVGRLFLVRMVLNDGMI